MTGPAPLLQSAWYNIVTKAGNGSWVLHGGSQPSDPTGIAKPLWNNPVTDLAHQQWQFWLVADQTYLVRNADFGSNMFLAGWDSDSPAPVLKNPSQYPNDESMLWKLTPGLDSYWGMTNLGNGTGFLLSVNASNHVSNYWQADLEHDDTVDTLGQSRLYFDQVASVTNTDFQSMQTPAVVAAALGSSTSTASPSAVNFISSASMTAASSQVAAATPSQCSDNAATSGMSAAAGAGISCAVTLVICSLIFGVAFVMLDRKFKKRAKTQEAAVQLRGWEQGYKEGSVAAMNQVPTSYRVGELGPGRSSMVPELYQGTPYIGELDGHGSG